MWLLRSTQVVFNKQLQPATLLIEEGRIAEILPYDQLPADVLLEDVGSLVVMPGCIDAHVHINEPGRTNWEGFATATQAAAAGGITTLVDMPLNSSPVTTTPEALQKKLLAAQGQLWVNCAFYAGVVPGHLAQLDELLAAGCVAGKAFMVHSGLDEFPAVGEAELRQAMLILKKHGKPLLAHAELELTAPVNTQPRSYSAYLASRPEVWEVEAIRLLIKLCRETGCAVHVVHLSAAAAVPLLAQAKAEGLPITVETAPHYLYFAAETIPDGATQFKCAPPIRPRANQEQLWQGLETGVIDFIATDHSPCEPELKQLASGDFTQAWGGIASLQWLLPAVWSQAKKRGFSVVKLAEWLSQRPAAFLGLTGRGEIAAGAVADLVVWNPEEEFEITPESVRHRHSISPYVGETVKGVIERTYVAGQLVYQTGRVVDVPLGQPLASPSR